MLFGDLSEVMDNRANGKREFGKPILMAQDDDDYTIKMDIINYQTL